MKSSPDSEPIKKPSLFLYLTELFRAIIEGLLSFRFRRNATRHPHADGHPVLVVPGFLTSDTSTTPLRKFLYKSGYHPFGWSGGRNLGNVRNDMQHILSRIDEIYEKCQEPVSLIGWSLGGVYARQAAKARPQIVRQIITLGSPFNGINEPNNAAWVYRLLHRGEAVEDTNADWIADLSESAPVPTTAIYSKRDGIVSWKVCMEKVEDPLHQNVQVAGSHLGFGVNESVLKIIVNRLQYSASNWTWL